MLIVYYQIYTCFYLYSIKIKNCTVSTKKVTKKEEPLSVNLAKPNGVKSLAFLVSLC